MALSHKLRQEIVNVLIELTFFGDANGRKAILLAAGLDTAIPNIDLSGPKAEFVNLLVEHLAQYGDVDGQPALVRLLYSLGEQVGQDSELHLADDRAKERHAPHPAPGGGYRQVVCADVQGSESHPLRGQRAQRGRVPGRHVCFAGGPGAPPDRETQYMMQGTRVRHCEDEVPP